MSRNKIRITKEKLLLDIFDQLSFSVAKDKNGYLYCKQSDNNLIVKNKDLIQYTPLLLNYESDKADQVNLYNTWDTFYLFSDNLESEVNFDILVSNICNFCKKEHSIFDDEKIFFNDENKLICINCYDYLDDDSYKIYPYKNISKFWPLVLELNYYNGIEWILAFLEYNDDGQLFKTTLTSDALDDVFVNEVNYSHQNKNNLDANIDLLSEDEVSQILFKFNKSISFNKILIDNPLTAEEVANKFFGKLFFKPSLVIPFKEFNEKKYCFKCNCSSEKHLLNDSEIIYTYNDHQGIVVKCNNHFITLINSEKLKDDILKLPYTYTYEASFTNYAFQQCMKEYEFVEVLRSSGEKMHRLINIGLDENEIVGIDFNQKNYTLKELKERNRKIRKKLRIETKEDLLLEDNKNLEQELKLAREKNQEYYSEKYPNPGLLTTFLWIFGILFILAILASLQN